MTFPLSSRPSIPKFYQGEVPASRARRLHRGEGTPARWIDAPTLRLDDAGIKEAARVVAMTGKRSPDEPFISEVPPGEP